MEYHSPVCRARRCRKSPLIFQHPSFILARRNNRHHFRVSSRMMPMPPGYTKVFGFVPTWCTTNALQKAARRFFATFKEGRRFCAFFLGIRDIGMMAGSARPLQINRKRHFGGDFRRGGGTPPYVLKGSWWGMSDIYRAKNGQRASGMSIKFQKFRDSSAKNSK